MKRFSWTIGWLAYSRTLRETQEEYDGWWFHYCFGFFVWQTKKYPGWFP